MFDFFLIAHIFPLYAMCRQSLDTSFPSYRILLVGYYIRTYRSLSFVSRGVNRTVSLDKEQTSYDDLLDALRLSLKGYNIK